MARRPSGAFGGNGARLGALVLGCLALAGCNASTKLISKVDPKYGVSASPRVIAPGQPVPKGGGAYRVGKPYVVAGRTYVPEDNRRYRRDGVASWYGSDFHGRLTANGEVYDMDGISAAHPTMPMPSYARVTNLQSGRSLIVRVNDRGPFHADRIIDLSSKAADLLELRRAGTGRVRVEYVGPAALEGSDDRRLMATLRDGTPAPAPSAVRVAAAKPLVPDLRDVTTPVRRNPLAEVEDRMGNDRVRPWTTDARAGDRRGRSVDESTARVAVQPVAMRGAARSGPGADALGALILRDGSGAVASGRGLY